MLQPYIHKKFTGTIWRLDIDNSSETLFLEIREQAHKKVYFASIGLDNGIIYFDDFITEERWLTGIETAYHGVLLLHNYQSESRPDHKGIIAVDAKNGEMLWSDYVSAFHHLSVNGPVIYDTRIQPPKLFLADVNTGAILRLYQPSIDGEPENILKFPGELPDDVLKDLPLPVTALANTIHYLEYSNFRIVSLHSLVEGALKQHLYIMDGNGVAYEDLLNTGIQKLQPESFFMHNNRLVYLKNKSEIKVLYL